MLKKIKTNFKKLLSLTFVGLASGNAFACAGMDPYIGSVCTTAATYCPDGYLDANGQTLQANLYPALYSLLGIIYGGTQGQNFNLPNMQGRLPVGMGTTITGGSLPIGTKRGSESITLTTVNLPTHNHNLGAAALVALNVSMNTANNKPGPDSTFNNLAASPSGTGAANIWTNTVTSPVKAAGIAISGTTDFAGQGLPVAVIAPQIALKYCIANTGVYPPRPN